MLQFRYSVFIKYLMRFLPLLALSFAVGGCAVPALLNHDNDADLSGGSYAGRTYAPIRPEIGLDSNIDSPANMYAGVSDGGYEIPAIPYERVPREFRRQLVPNITGERPGTIVVDTKTHFLYFTLPEGDAVRYGVGVGKQGFEWSGRAHVQYKKEWPRWTPPREMIGRQPELVKYKNGMEPGITNPLGARAFYVFRKNAQGQNVDTGYRIHGSPEWWSIGHSMSSGCIRLLNQDIIDLYGRVNSGTAIVVR